MVNVTRRDWLKLAGATVVSSFLGSSAAEEKKESPFIDEKDLEKIYRNLRGQIKKAYEEAVNQKKPFYIVTGEVHTSPKSMFYTNMVYEIAKELKIPYMPELDDDLYKAMVSGKKGTGDDFCQEYPTYSHFVSPGYDKKHEVLPVDLKDVKDIRDFEDLRDFADTNGEALQALVGGAGRTGLDEKVKKLSGIYTPFVEAFYKERLAKIEKVAKSRQCGYLQLGQSHVHEIIERLEPKAAVFAVITDMQFTVAVKEFTLAAKETFPGETKIYEDMYKFIDNAKKRPNTYCSTDKPAVYDTVDEKITDKDIELIDKTRLEAIQLSTKVIPEIAKKVREEERLQGPKAPVRAPVQRTSSWQI